MYLDTCYRTIAVYLRFLRLRLLGKLRERGQNAEPLPMDHLLVFQSRHYWTSFFAE